MIEKVGVIGAGQMGNGIAHVCALKGFEVVLVDVDQEHVNHAVKTIRRNLERQVRRNLISGEDEAKAMGHIHGVVGLDRLNDVDLAIEAVTENEEVKKKVLVELCPHLKPEAVVASNTSSISITRLASVTDRPEQFMGMHFMNPVPMMKLIELIRGIATSEETFAAVRELTIKLDKEPANSEDFPAFIVNRLLQPMINEAVYTLYEGVGSVEAIDIAMRLGANHPMGPLQLADFIGLDVCLAVMQVLYEGLADSKYRPCPLLVKYVEAGWLGRKAGRGFYDYSGDTPVPTR